MESSSIGRLFENDDLAFLLEDEMPNEICLQVFESQLPKILVSLKKLPDHELEILFASIQTELRQRQNQPTSSSSDFNDRSLDDGSFMTHIVDDDNGKKEHIACSWPDCNRTFDHQSSFRRHYADVHIKLKRFQCEFCGKTFTRKDSVVSHLHARARLGECRQRPGRNKAMF
jgi:hypothetical protein